MKDFNSMIGIIALVVIAIFGFVVGNAFGGFFGGVLGVFMLPVLVLALFAGQ